MGDALDTRRTMRGTTDTWSAQVFLCPTGFTLLNTDVKLLARVMVQRMSAGLDAVVDATQTAIIPGRWIGKIFFLFFFYFLNC